MPSWAPNPPSPSQHDDANGGSSFHDPTTAAASLTGNRTAYPLDRNSFNSDISAMTEISENELRPAVERFVLHWGDMGSRWGVNRSVAQIQALLYLSERLLTADEIAETLGLARSN